ncbi:MAG: hypothetical protein WCB49_13370, partial [Gammaproteobacteria bacterium]
WGPWVIFLRRKLRQTTIGNSPVRPRWRPDLNQTASAIPGAVQISFIVIAGLISDGFSAKNASGEASLVFALVVGIIIFSTSFSFIIALWFKLAAITIHGGAITGRSYWGFKNRIPLNDIETLVPFRGKNGISAIVVKSKCHGKVYISDHTENLEELLDLLLPYLPKRENSNV